jgi:hypothetical protein
MIAYVTKTFQELHVPENTRHEQSQPGDADADEGKIESNGTWLKDFKHLVASLEPTSHNVTSLLAILSGAIGSGKPLPPYLRAPEWNEYHIGEMLTTLDEGILSTRHICEPGCSAFAVLQVSTTMLAEGLADLLVDAKKLVGEADFELDGLDVVQQDYERHVGAEPVLPALRSKAD